MRYDIATRALIYTTRELKFLATNIDNGKPSGVALRFIAHMYHVVQYIGYIVNVYSRLFIHMTTARRSSSRRIAKLAIVMQEGQRALEGHVLNRADLFYVLSIVIGPAINAVTSRPI